MLFLYYTLSVSHGRVTSYKTFVLQNARTPSNWCSNIISNVTCTMFVYSLCLSLLLLPLSTAFKVKDRHVVPCDVQRTVCECRETADECEFTLLIEELQTFTAYKVRTTDPGFVNVDQLDIQSLKEREEEGKPFYINGTGDLIPSFIFDQDSDCITYNEDFSGAECTVPLTVDGRTYRPCIAVNGQVPGPTLVVYEDQVVVVNVINALLTETVSIHWHGMDQMNTPWMDGAIHVSQCPISPSESFRYYFKAAPTGSFWYHSHRVTQRADGLFGALIIRESADSRDNLSEALEEPVIIDEPGSYTINLHEWDRKTNLDRYTLVKGEISFFPEKPLGEIPLPLEEQIAMGVANPYGSFIESSGPDGLSLGDIPYFSGLINGKGRNKDVPYNRTRLEVFEVESGGVYRFRLIGAQSQYAYKFSIDEHTLRVMSTDGSLIEPVEAQFIILHTGERYDFLLKANKPRENVHNYWMRAETLAVDMTNELPYPSLGQVAEAILHYNPAPTPKSTSYESIKSNSIPFSVEKCGKLGGCVAVNCPFRDFHSSYNTRCINVYELRMLWPTSSSELPSANLDPDCTDCEFFFNIGSDTDNINGRNMVLPPFPLQTQKVDISSTEFCDVSKPCNGDSEDCSCVHVREVKSFNKTIRFILSSVGDEVVDGGGFSHPMHLHGHHFHVVEVGYGSYYSNNGSLKSRNNDISCGDAHCSNPEWNTSMQTFSINKKTVKKDTIIVPGGGYVVFHFRSNNPGFWFMHCHIISDLLEGMSVVINEVESRQSPAPVGFPTCGGFHISQEQYYASVAYDPDSAGSRLIYSWWLLLMLVVCGNIF